MQKPKTREMAQLAILTAIIILFTFTPVGYLSVGVVEITFLPIPVAIGAILTGPIGGAFLGAVFGVTALIKCIIGSPLSFLLTLDPVLTVITCIVPRILCGMIPGFLFRALRKVDRTKVVSYMAASLSTALLNTVFFVGCLLLCFWNNQTFLDVVASFGISTTSIWLFVVGFAGVNALIEAAVSCVVGGAIGKALVHLQKDE